MHGFWPIFFLLVVLKVPVFSALGLVWWASRPAPEPDGAQEDPDGGFRRFRPQPKRPGGPRRGPHGGGAAQPLPPCPPAGRTRVTRPAALPAYARGASRGATRPRPTDT
jgi:hypothetical protein